MQIPTIIMLGICIEYLWSFPLEQSKDACNVLSALKTPIYVLSGHFAQVEFLLLGLPRSGHIPF